VVSDVSDRAGATTAINQDAALNEIDEMRGDLGVIQNRFESTISNLQNVSENISAARSRIVDADFAAETAVLYQVPDSAAGRHSHAGPDKPVAAGSKY